LANDRDLEDRLMDEYARSFGHVPTANWILVVHADNSSEFHIFEDPSEMWCCQSKDIIRKIIDEEVKQLEAANLRATA
jgi:hypothetical protein